MKHYERQGKIKSSFAALLVNAVKGDYKNDALVIEDKKKQMREANRLAREVEVQESEQLMQQQREKRAVLRAQVAQHIDQMNKDTFSRYEEEFKALTLPNAPLPDALHDFIAEPQR